MVPILRQAFRVSGLVIAASILVAVPSAHADYCVQEPGVDLCYQGRVSYPCTCLYDDGWTIQVDTPDIDRDPPRVNNDLPGRGNSNRPSGGGGGAPIINGGGGRGGGGGGRR